MAPVRTEMVQTDAFAREMEQSGQATAAKRLRRLSRSR